MNKIGLALSGGGALGVAHLGILESLEQCNIKRMYQTGYAYFTVRIIFAMLYLIYDDLSIDQTG